MHLNARECARAPPHMIVTILICSSRRSQQRRERRIDQGEQHLATASNRTETPLMKRKAATTSTRIWTSRRGDSTCGNHSTFNARHACTFRVPSVPHLLPDSVFRTYSATFKNIHIHSCIFLHEAGVGMRGVTICSRNALECVLR